MLGHVLKANELRVIILSEKKLTQPHHEMIPFSGTERMMPTDAEEKGCPAPWHGESSCDSNNSLEGIFIIGHNLLWVG